MKLISLRIFCWHQVEDIILQIPQEKTKQNYKMAQKKKPLKNNYEL